MNLFHRYNRREILFLAALAAVIGLVLALEGIRMLADHRHKSARSIAVKQETAARVAELKTRFDALQADVNARRKLLEQRSGTFSLVSYLNQLAQQAGIQEQIQQIQPSRVPSTDPSLHRSIVEMKLRAVPLRQLADWVYRIETSGPLISVLSAVLSVSETSPDRVDLTIQVQTLEP